MKTTLTIKQSATIIRKGVSAERASEYKLNPAFDDLALEWRKPLPVFTLADLLSLLPKTINSKALYMECLGTTWEVGYRCERKTFSILEVIYKEELIDALYELVLWCIDNHVKLD